MSVSFTIATPVLNGMPLLCRCVGSVRGQKGVSFEHVIQDGGSNDGTVEWLNTQRDLHAVTGQDGGMYDAIARGWARGTGEVLSWLNADEQYLPGTLSLVQRAFAEHPDVDFLFGNAIITSPGGDPLAARREIPLRPAFVRHGFLYALSCTLFFRRRLWETGLLRFNPAYKLAGDMDVVLSLLEHGLKVMHVPAYLAVFTAGRDNLSTLPGMAAETLAIRRAHGAMPGRLAQRLVMCGRYLERAVRGCYRPDDLDFQFALDEKPTYRTVVAKRVGWSFSHERASRQVRRMTHEIVA